MIDTTKFKIRSNVTESVKTTKDVFDAANQLGIKSWLFFGALLGIRREGRLFSWNNDVEICAYACKNYHQKVKKMSKILSKKGYNCIYYKNISALSVRSRVDGAVVNLNFATVFKNNLIRPHETADGTNNVGISPISFFCWWVANFLNSECAISFNTFLKISLKNKLKILIILSNKVFPKIIKKKLNLILFKLNYFFGGKSLSTAIPINLIEPLSIINFYGKEVYAPSKIDDYLRYIYGDDWMVPKENWSFYKNTNETYMKYMNIKTSGIDLDKEIK